MIQKGDIVQVKMWRTCEVLETNEDEDIYELRDLDTGEIHCTEIENIS